MLLKSDNWERITDRSQCETEIAAALAHGIKMRQVDGSYKIEYLNLLLLCRDVAGVVNVLTVHRSSQNLLDAMEPSLTITEYNTWNHLISLLWSFDNELTMSSGVATILRTVLTDLRTNGLSEAAFRTIFHSKATLLPNETLPMVDIYTLVASRGDLAALRLLEEFGGLHDLFRSSNAEWIFVHAQVSHLLLLSLLVCACFSHDFGFVPSLLRGVRPLRWQTGGLVRE